MGDLIGVEPYVLRYWETEFSQLRPGKNRGGQRTYRKKDVQTILRIRELVRDEGYTIAGAKRQLKEERASPEKKNQKKKDTKADEFLTHLKQELTLLLGEVRGKRRA